MTLAEIQAVLSRQVEPNLLGPGDDALDAVSDERDAVMSVLREVWDYRYMLFDDDGNKFPDLQAKVALLNEAFPEKPPPPIWPDDPEALDDQE